MVEENVEPGKLFVGGLSWTTDEVSLKTYFEKWGEVAETIVMRDQVTKKPRGFGFVQYKDPECATQALKQKEHTLDSKKIDPKPATLTHNPTGVKKVFVGGIPSTVDEEEVLKFFSAYGEVVEIDLKIDRDTGRMRGFGFVGFKDEAVVQRLIDIHYLTLKGKKIEIKKAEPRFLANAAATTKLNYHQQIPAYTADAWGGFRYSGYPTGAYHGFSQQPGGQQQYGARASGGGGAYGTYGGAGYGQPAAGASFQQYGYGYAAAHQQQQMSNFGQDSNSYAATGGSYTSDAYVGAGFYNDTSSYQHYTDQTSGVASVASATGFPRTAATQPRGAGAAYNSFGGAR